MYFGCVDTFNFRGWRAKVQDNKKVLLHDRKRHTTRRVASTHSAVLSRVWGGGVPQSCPGQEGGGGATPVLSWTGEGVPQSCPGWGGATPVLGATGVPPGWDWGTT